MTTKQKDRQRRLAPAGIPRWVRVYDNEGETMDRYTVVFTGRYKARDTGSTDILTMSAHPYHPQGVGCSDCIHGVCEGVHAGQWPPSLGRRGHFGIRIEFAALPRDCQRAAWQDYSALWGIRNQNP